MPRKAFYDEGPYLGEVTSQGLTEAKTGTVQFVLRFKVVGVPKEGEMDQFVAPKRVYERTIYMALTEKTMEFVTENLKNIGFAGTSLSQLDPSNSEHHSFVGQEIDLYCKIWDAQDGGEQEKWMLSSPRRTISAAGSEVDQKKIRSLDKLFGRQMRTTNMGKVPPSKPTPQPGQSDQSDQGITDEDIPF